VTRALVTGAGGFVGSNLTRRLLRDGIAVACLVRSGDNWRLAGVPSGIELIEGDLCEGDSLSSALAGRRFDWVFHLAAYGAYSWQEDLARMLAVNVLGTANLIRALSGASVEAFVNAGTSSEYGFTDHPAFEEDRLQPNSAYAVTKAASTHLCSDLARRGVMPATTLRLYSAYGPLEEPERLMPTLICRGLRGELPELASSSIARDFVYIDDVCDAFVAAARSHVAASDPGLVINVGSGVQTSLGELVALAQRVLSIGGSPHWGTMPDRRWDTPVWVANIKRAQSVLQWTPRTDLETGFRATVEWMRSEGLHLSRYAAR
jgi:UDP-glucose 4-epimerase